MAHEELRLLPLLEKKWTKRRSLDYGLCLLVTFYEWHAWHTSIIRPNCTARGAAYNYVASKSVAEEVVEEEGKATTTIWSDIYGGL